MSTYNTFKSLHDTTFILPNAWNPESARLLQQNNFKAVGTSSAAVATSLGYEDGEDMPFAEYLMIIRRIAASVSIPLTVDMEMGYGKTADEIYRNFQNLIDAGVAGINIEDSFIVDGVRSLKDADKFARKVEFIRNKLSASGQSLFINVRCDTYILNVNDKTKESTARIKRYESAGADGIFLPVIHTEQDIRQAVADTKLPINVMLIPGLPNVDTLTKLGVKRISMGPFLHNKVYGVANQLIERIVKGNDLGELF